MELLEAEASWVSAWPAVELSPDSMACTMARMSAAVSAAEFVFDEALAVLLAEDAFNAVELSVSMSPCADERLPLERSLPNWPSSLTKVLAVVVSPPMLDSRLVVMPLESVVAVVAVEPLCASLLSVT